MWYLGGLSWWQWESETSEASISDKKVWANVDRRRSKSQWLPLKVVCSGESDESLWL